MSVTPKKILKTRILIVTAITLMLLVTACGGGKLVYRVEGGAEQAEVTYIDANGASQSETVSLPWETAFSVGSNAEFSLSAKSAGEQDGISCAVLLDDKELGRVDANNYASCEGSFKKSGGSLSVNFHSRKDVSPGGNAAKPQAADTPASSGDNAASPQATDTPIPPTPKPSPTPSASDHVDQGMAYYEQGELDKAIAEFQAALELEPDASDAYRNLGTAYGKQGEWEKALAAYEQAVDIDPNFGKAYGDMVGAYASLGKLEEAIAAGEKAVEMVPDYATAHNNLGVAYRQQDRIDEAIAEFQKAMQLDPDDAMPHFNMGVIYYKQDQFDQAIDEWLEAKKLDQNYAMTHKNLGIVYLDLDQPADALTELELYLQLAPDASDKEQVEKVIAKLNAELAPPAEDTADQQQSGKNIKTYNNKYMGLTLEYPASWTLKEGVSDEAAIVVLGTDKNFAAATGPEVYVNPGASIQIALRDLGQFSADNLPDLQAEILKDDYPPLTPIGKISPVSISGKLGNSITGIEGLYTPDLDKGPPIKFAVTTLVQSGRVLVIVGIWNEEYEDQVISDIKQVFSSIDLQLTPPELFMNAIFLSAQQEDYSILSKLCHPDVDNDSDTQAICDMETTDPAVQVEFANYFKKGKLTGMAHFSKDGTQAEVPFLFGPDGDQEETMKFILYNDKWYLYSF